MILCRCKIFRCKALIGRQTPSCWETWIRISRRFKIKHNYWMFQALWNLTKASMWKILHTIFSIKCIFLLEFLIGENKAVNFEKYDFQNKIFRLHLLHKRKMSLSVSFKEEIQSVTFERHDFEYREKVKLVPPFAFVWLSETWRREQKRSFLITSIAQNLLIDSLMRKEMF